MPFNYIYIQKHLKMNISSSIVHWGFTYLINLPQFVSLKRSRSAVVWTNTGVPQGTVLVQFLFTVYTADFRHSDSLCHMIVFADDSEITGKIRNDDGSVDSEEINSL